MRVAFVGVKRKYRELDKGYVDFFNRYHLELPYYYAKYGEMEVKITTPDYTGDTQKVGVYEKFRTFGVAPDYMPATLRCVYEQGFVEDTSKYDVVVHWRKWFPEFYRPEAINVINCQDHSFSNEWKNQVGQAFVEKKLTGILCFPTWHKQNLIVENKGFGMAGPQYIDGLTLGVDTDVYHPADDKDPYQLLWASDPGRGFQQCLQLFMQLYQLDRRFRLNVCWPDYCSFSPPLQHPGIVWHGNVPNGPKLWDLFNRCGILPYTSSFREPSSRAHRQAQAAGSLVLYPPGMGSPSELIESDRTGIVAPVHEWPRRILELVNSGRWKEIGQNAREYAISENWEVQALRFRKYFEKALALRERS